MRIVHGNKGVNRGLNLVLLTIAMSLITTNSFAAVKTGSACGKIGISIMSAGKTYTCIKSDKKFVWSKGVKKSSTKPAPTPTPVVYPKAPSGFDDLIENYKGISYAAWSKSREKILSSNNADATLNLVIGPNTKLTYKEPQTSVDLVTRLYAGYPTKGEFYFLAFNFADRDWATSQMDLIMPSAGSRWISDIACKTKEFCWGGGAFSDGSGKYLIVETMGYIDTNHVSGSLEAHEFTHIVQQMSFKKARPAARYLYDPWPPTWYWEGHAHFAQHASIYFDSYKSYLAERNATAHTLFSDPTFDSEHIRKYFVFNAPEDWQNAYDQWHQYDLGAMFVEVLTAIKGPDSTMEMWRLTGTGMNFPDAFEKIYGISFDAALPTISKAIALELGRS